MTLELRLFHLNKRDLLPKLLNYYHAINNKVQLALSENLEHMKK